MTSAVSCPKCGAHDAKYLNVVHEAGLSSVDTRTRGGGCSPMSFLLFPFIGFWSLLFSSFGKSRTSGTVQSAASARAEPPTRKPVAFSLFMAVVGLFLLSGHTGPGVLLLLLGGLSFYAALTYNTRIYPYQRQVWEQSAMCQRCGTVFVPEPDRITLDAVTTGQLLGEHQRHLTAAAQPLLNRAQTVGGQVVQNVVQKTGELRAAASRETEVGTPEPRTPSQDADSEK